jgi:hypothetical protein
VYARFKYESAVGVGLAVCKNLSLKQQNFVWYSFASKRYFISKLTDKENMKS